MRSYQKLRSGQSQQAAEILDWPRDFGTNYF
jgi:hypothetical protein